MLRRRRAADLPQPRRARPGADADERQLPAGRGRRRGEHGRRDQGRLPRAAGPQRLDRRRQARGLEGHRPRLHQGARRATSPTAPHSTADMAHPTRTGDLVVFSTPPYQFDAATPGTLIARSAFFGQHGYVPDVQDLESNTNMRATFLAGGDAIKRGVARDVRSIDLAPTAAFLLDVPAPQHSQGVVRRDILDDGPSLHAAVDHRAQRLPRSARPDDDADGQPQRDRRRGVALATMFDEEAAALPEPSLLLAAGDNVGASPPNSALLDDRPAIDVENAWGLDATSFGNHEFDFGVERILAHEARANFPFLSANIVEEDTGAAAGLGQGRRRSSASTACASASSAPRSRRRRSSCRPAPPRACAFLDEAERIRRESARLRALGVKVQIVVIHEGAALGANAHRRQRRRRRGRARSCRSSQALQRHDRRPRHRRPHAPHRQHGRRPHPGGRGRQRRRQLLGGAADGQGRRRRLGRRRHARGQEHRRRGPGRRAGDRRPGQRRDGGAAQPGDRHAERRHPARPGPAQRVGDGQPRRRRDAR